MMICPETYYRENLQGKTKEEMLRIIASLKREMARLKRIIEHPDYAPTMCPSEDTRLWCTRLYLERAKEALTDVGAVYEPTAAEKRFLDFDANIDNIEKITLQIGGFLYGWSTYTVRLDEHIQFCVEHMPIPAPTNVDLQADEPMTKDEFLEEFAELHIGEWRKSYDTSRFGIQVLDGTQWDLTIEYNNGRKLFKVSGDNAYPYNFRKLTELLGVDIDDDSEEE